MSPGLPLTLQATLFDSLPCLGGRLVCNKGQEPSLSLLDHSESREHRPCGIFHLLK